MGRTGADEGRVWAENRVKAAPHTGVKDGALVACSWLLARGSWLVASL